VVCGIKYRIRTSNRANEKGDIYSIFCIGILSLYENHFGATPQEFEKVAESSFFVVGDGKGRCCG